MMRIDMGHRDVFIHPHMSGSPDQVSVIRYVPFQRSEVSNAITLQLLIRPFLRKSR